MAKKSYAVCGLGAFGSRLAEELTRSGHSVMACDVNPAKVNAMRDKVLQALIADVSDIEAIRELDISKFDAVILSLSKYFEKQVLEAFLDGKSYQEIADKLGRHVKSIDNALQRVKRKLEKYLEESGRNDE